MYCLRFTFSVIVVVVYGITRSSQRPQKLKVFKQSCYDLMHVHAEVRWTENVGGGTCWNTDACCLKRLRDAWKFAWCWKKGLLFDDPWPWPWGIEYLHVPKSSWFHRVNRRNSANFGTVPNASIFSLRLLRFPQKTDSMRQKWRTCPNPPRLCVCNSWKESLVHNEDSKDNLDTYKRIIKWQPFFE